MGQEPQGIAISNLLMNMGAGDVILCDSRGAFVQRAFRRHEPVQRRKAERTNKKGAKTLAEALEGADVFIGVSVGGVLTRTW